MSRNRLTRETPAPSPSAAVPFYPHHWRLLTAAVATALVWVALLYIPSSRERVAAQRAEQARLDTAAATQAELATRWEAVRRRREVGAPATSEADMLLTLQGAASTWRVVLTDVRPALDSAGALWRVHARARYGDALAFLAALEAPPSALRFEAVRLASPDTAAGTLRMEATLRAPRPR